MNDEKQDLSFAQDTKGFADLRHGARIPVVTTPSPSKLIVRSTDEVVITQRLDYWIGAVCESLFRISSTQAETPDFSCRLSACPLDELFIIQARGSMRSTFQTKASLAKADSYSFSLMADFAGPAWIEWRGEVVLINPGDLFFADTRYAHSFRRCTSAIHIRIPPIWATAWMSNPERFAGRRIAKDVGWGAALSSFVSQMSPEFAAASPLQPKLLSDSLGGLLALVEAEVQSLPSTSSVKERHLVDLAKDTLRQRASECGLTAAEVASSINVSERSLHRCLASQGVSFSLLLAEARIDRARRMLEAKNLGRLSTAEIGRRAGFLDPSYFVRTATKHLGLTPRQYRLAHMK